MTISKQLQTSGADITRRNFSILGAAAGFAALLPRGAAATTGQPVPGGSLIWGLESEPTTLNPHLHNLAKTKLLIRNSYEPLLSRNAAGDYLPWLAKSYKVSEDGLKYTFELRDDVKFTDGQTLTAEAVALNYNRYTDIDYAGPLSSGPIQHLRKARATGAHTVELELKQPYSSFLFFVSQFEIISPAAFDSADLKAGGPAIAGTGPFILERYVKGQEIAYRRNPDYNWAPPVAAHQGPAYLENVVYRFLPESSVRTGALVSGQVDVIEGISGNDADLFGDDKEYVYQTAPNGGTPFTLFFNTANGLTTDERLRKAVVASVDLDAILQSIYRGHRERAWAITTPVDTLFYDKSVEKRYGNDPKLANSLLDEAGWTGRDAQGFRTKDGKRLTVEVVQSTSVLRDQRDVLLQALQAQARQNAGIDLAIVQVDSGTHRERRRKGEYAAIANSNTAADGYGIEIHYLPLDDGGRNNFNGSATPEQTEWIKAASLTQDTAKRFELYSKVQKLVLLDQALALPLYISQDQIAAGKHVHGTGFRPYYQLVESAYDVWLDKEAKG